MTYNSVCVFAHSEMLDVSYDDCDALSTGDGIDEMWYVLDKDSECRHLSHTDFTIYYYFEEKFEYKDSNGDTSSYTWTTTAGTPAEAIKSAYAASMEKWNNVYFYTYASDGTVIKNRLIYIIEGTGAEDGHNLSIYPAMLCAPAVDSMAIPAVTTVDETRVSTQSDSISHKHYSKWMMMVDPICFYETYGITQSEAHFNLNTTGAHEIGHILGLRDLDESNLCGADADKWHHHEALMGYGEPVAERTTNITYKDIAGVAITRDFHTDNDHKWLYAGQQSDGTYKLICTICNGVKKVDSLSGYTYDVYGSCGDNHDLVDGNMMAVASYGTKDYYKCKYCRYVAPFDNNVEQNYVVTAYKDEARHWCVNNVTGLSYIIEEAHRYTYTYRDSTKHTAVCVCGHSANQAHWIKRADIVNNKGICVDCGAIIDMRVGFGEAEPLAIQKVSVNGSYILPNGIAVIVDADVEAYRNGTLVFYDPGDVPVTQ